MQNPIYNSSSTFEPALSQNRVLRNTYALLGLSMLPTAAGAWLGIQMGFSLFAGSPLISFLLFMAIAFGFFYFIEKNKNNSLGVVLLLGFTFFMGLMLSRILQFTLGFSNGASILALAAGGTGAIFFAMASIASVVKRDLSGMSKFLFVGLLLIVLASVANIFLQIPALALTLSVGVCLLFSAYLMYDLNQIMRGGETNYIRATLMVYLDVYNIFVSLIQLLTAFTGERD